jgi:hypothetical protein
MIPTTIDVAAVSPIERLSSMDMSVKAARFYHALLILLCLNSSHLPPASNPP